MLSNGKVLVTGGDGDGSDFQNTAELYDPSTGNWSLTDSMCYRRIWHTATTLNNGKVLVTGGMNAASGDAPMKFAELYDPSTEKWKNVSSMNYPRYGHTATLLPNGKVLAVGGVDLTYSSSNTAELFDPSTETWAVTRGMFDARTKHTASLLRSGKVLVAGGATGDQEEFPGFNPLKTAEIYDPSTSVWINTSSMHYTRAWHTASAFENGDILVVGGRLDSEYGLYSSELYNSSTNTYISLS
jgi:N-acetylneuraminic acid mutarotase